MFSKYFAVRVVLPRVRVETDLIFQTHGNAFTGLFRREKSLTVIYHLLELTITVYIEHFLLETNLKQL